MNTSKNLTIASLVLGGVGALLFIIYKVRGANKSSLMANGSKLLIAIGIILLAIAVLLLSSQASSGLVGPTGPRGPAGPAGAAILPKTADPDVLTNIPRWDDPVRLYMRSFHDSDPGAADYCSASQGESCDFNRLIPPGYLVASNTPAGKTPMPNPNPSSENACQWQKGSGPRMNCPQGYSQCLNTQGKLVTQSSPNGYCSLDSSNWEGALYLGKSAWG